MLCNCIFRLRKNLYKILFGQAFQLYSNRESALKLRNQIRYFGNMKSACSNKEHIVRLYGAVFSHYRASLDNRQDISLHAFARYIRTAAHCFSGYLIYLIEEDYAVLLRTFYSYIRDLIHVYHALRFFLLEYLSRFVYGELFSLCVARQNA